MDMCNHDRELGTNLCNLCLIRSDAERIVEAISTAPNDLLRSEDWLQRRMEFRTMVDCLLSRVGEV